MGIVFYHDFPEGGRGISFPFFICFFSPSFLKPNVSIVCTMERDCRIIFARIFSQDHPADVGLAWKRGERLLRISRFHKAIQRTTSIIKGYRLTDPSQPHIPISHSSSHQLRKILNRSTRSLANLLPSPVFIIPSNRNNFSSKCSSVPSSALPLPFPFAAPNVNARPIPTAPNASSRSASCTMPNSGWWRSTPRTRAGLRISWE